MKRRNLVTGALAIVALMGVLAVVPFGATAQRPPQVLLSFNNFECPGACAAGAPVCCYVAPPIVVVIDDD
ncbi:MAG: hypothetical protein OXI39_00650 [Gemmatimonadota bacterium]|uniref:hypothetical protein n=1 Tax=Candidatus Palauibacter scopulicola TaxID=3056741 RepID=UPI0023A30BF1|nr:hypothetical protein [Candidatus Palauibacter scopulicola]MDE2661501.1 hypothetical protein [Candidatus Palauibacter scopulicola]